MLYLSQQLILDQNLTNEEVLTYVFVQIQTYSNNYDSCILRTSDVVDQAFGEVNSHSLNVRIRKNIHSLIEQGYLDVITQNQTLRIFMTSFEPNKEDRFIKVDASDLRDIVDKTERKKADMLRFYLLVLTTITQNKTGCHDEGWFAKVMNVSNQTICRYFSHLEKIQKIYVYRSASFYQSNTYGRFNDKKAIESMGERRSGGRKAHSDANEKRRCVAIYYNFLEGKDYPIDVLKEVLAKLEQRNEQIKNLGDRGRGQLYDLQPLIDKINGK